jgi:dihydropyrimidinase
VFDPDVKHTISAETHQMDVDYDPFEGWEVQGQPRFVLSRGTTVAQEGKSVSEPGHGRFVKRSIFEPALPNA